MCSKGKPTSPPAHGRRSVPSARSPRTARSFYQIPRRRPIPGSIGCGSRHRDPGSIRDILMSDRTRDCRGQAHPDNAWQRAGATILVTVVRGIVAAQRAGAEVSMEGRTPNRPAHEERMHRSRHPDVRSDIRMSRVVSHPALELTPAEGATNSVTTVHGFVVSVVPIFGIKEAHNSKNDWMVLRNLAL